MANIVISRIQHRRGRRENLPQPLLPAEVALTSDTSQAWMGQDPALAVPSINVYTDKLTSTAQSIVDNNIAESKFDENFTSTIFNTLVAELTGTPTPAVVLTESDILWDSTYRGVILDISTITTPGTGYTTGDVITAISATGSGFVGTVTAAAGAITGVVITSGGQNYRQSNTTFTIANGSSGEINLTLADVHGYSVHVAADLSVDALNTIANVTSAIAATSATITNRLISTAAYGGTFIAESLLVNNHIEAANVTALMNRVNSTTPSENTGLVHTNLNIELTAARDDITSFQLAASDLTSSITSGTDKAYFRMPRGMTLTEVRASLLTASTSGAVTIDVNKNTVSVLSTLLTIDQDEKTSVTAAVPAVISDGTLADDDEIVIDIDGAGTGAVGLIITLIGVA